LVKCPRCSFEIADPSKTWPMISRPDISGGVVMQTVALYRCGNCGEIFRRFINREKIVIKDIVEKSKAMEEMIVEAANKKVELEKKIKDLEQEKNILQEEVEALKVLPELVAKSSALEAEVTKLREEKRELEEKAVPGQAPPEEESIETQTPTEEQEPGDSQSSAEEQVPAETQEQAEETTPTPTEDVSP
jgi:hypothetical protein